MFEILTPDAAQVGTGLDDLCRETSLSQLVQKVTAGEASSYDDSVNLFCFGRLNVIWRICSVVDLARATATMIAERALHRRHLGDGGIKSYSFAPGWRWNSMLG